MARLINKRNTLLLIALIALILGGMAFRSGMPSDGVARPEDLVTRYRPNAEFIMTQTGPQRLVGCLKLCWFANSHPSAVVLYREPSRQNGTPGGFSWELAAKSDGTWHSLAGGSADGASLSHDPALLSVVSMPVPKSSITWRFGVAGDYVMTLGQALSPDVARVDVGYSSGQTVRAELTNGAFALITQADAVCELRLLAADGSLLQRIDAADDPRLSFGAPGGCPAA